MWTQIRLLLRSSLIRVHTVCLYAKNRFEKSARIFSRRHKQTTFSDAVFLGALRVNMVICWKVWDHNLNIVWPWRTYVQGRSETYVGMSGLVSHPRNLLKSLSVLGEHDNKFHIHCSLLECCFFVFFLSLAVVNWWTWYSWFRSVERCDGDTEKLDWWMYWL